MPLYHIYGLYLALIVYWWLYIINRVLPHMINSHLYLYLIMISWLTLIFCVIYISFTLIPSRCPIRGLQIYILDMMTLYIERMRLQILIMPLQLQNLCTCLKINHIIRWILAIKLHPNQKPPVVFVSISDNVPDGYRGRICFKCC